jgi:transposase
VRKRERKPDPERDRRMAAAVRLTTEGLSLREVSERLSVSHQTVANYLAEWETALPRLPLSIVRLSKPTVKNTPQTGVVLTAPFDTNPNVIPLRRLA